jgi:hypothetical protein
MWTSKKLLYIYTVHAEFKGEEPELYLNATIDISLEDWAYKSSTFDGMYRRQRRHLYYGGQFRSTIWPPSPQLSLHRKAIQTEHGPYIAERTQKSSLYCEMSMNAAPAVMLLLAAPTPLQ